MNNLHNVLNKTIFNPESYLIMGAAGVLFSLLNSNIVLLTDKKYGIVDTDFFETLERMGTTFSENGYCEYFMRGILSGTVFGMSYPLSIPLGLNVLALKYFSKSEK